VSGAAATKMSNEELQATLFGYADTYIALVSQSADNLMARRRDAEYRVRAIRAKLDGSEAVVQIVTGPNPTVALLDLAVMVTIQHQVWIDYWKPSVFKEDSYNFMDSMERLEKEIWQIAAKALTPEQVSDLRELAGQIRQQYIHQVYVTSLRASQITSSLGDPSSKVKPSSGLLSLFGLDPALAEVSQTRLLAERMFFFGQKAPTLLGWRVDLQLATAMTAPETELALKNADEAVKNTTRFADVAESLPRTIAQERAAILRGADEVVSNEVGRLAVAISNERTAFFAGIAEERRSLLQALDEGQGTARAVLADLRTTMDAATQLSGSINTVVGQVNQLVQPAGATGAGGGTREPGRPFDILEYQRTIESATITIKELNSTLVQARELMESPNWKERESSIGSLMGELERRARSLVILGAIGLCAAIFFALAGAAVVRRVLSRERSV